MIAPTPKEARALALRREGLKWTEIGRIMGMSAGNAYQRAMMAEIKEFRLQEAAKER